MMLLKEQQMWSDDLEPCLDLEEQQDEMLRGKCFGGGKGGGSAPPAPTEQTVNQSNLPDYVEPYFTRLLQRTEAESNRGYTPYGEERIAGFAPETEQAFGGISDIYAGGTPQQLQDASQVVGDVSQYQAQQFPDNVSQYMNPYIENVLDVQQDRAMRRFNEQQLNRNTAAVQAGAFGGSRQAVADSMAQRDLNEQLARMEAEGLAGAYESGAQIFARDESARQSAEAMRLGAGQQLGQLGMMDQALGFERAQQMAGVGGMRQAQDQTGLDLAYQDFINQRDYPRQQLNFYSSILRGVPISAQSEITQYQVPPSPIQQFLGTGIAGLGAVRGLQDLFS